MITHNNVKAPYNPTIAKLFRYVGIAENAGYGMNKLASWETLTGSAPTIESDRTIATVSFPLKSALQRQNQIEGHDDAKNVPKNVPVNVPVKLTDTQRSIMDMIKVNGDITHAEMARTLSITEKTAKRATMTLRDLGLIKRIGSDKTGHCEITDQS